MRQKTEQNVFDVFFLQSIFQKKLQNFCSSFGHKFVIYSKIKQKSNANSMPFSIGHILQSTHGDNST